MKPMRKVEAPAVLNHLQEMVVAFGLTEEFEEGNFTCPVTDERITWDTLGRIHIDGENVKLFSINARLQSNKLRSIS
jgi:hypothetical protein